jgi:hypothetical protein
MNDEIVKHWLENWTKFYNTVIPLTQRSGKTTKGEKGPVQTFSINDSSNIVVNNNFKRPFEDDEEESDHSRKRMDT